MAQKTDAELTTQAQIIRDETTELANTKQRVYDNLKDIIDSKLNNEDVEVGAVDSVNGQVGVVVLSAANIPNTPAGTIASTTAQAAVNELDGDIQGHITDTAAAHAASAIAFTPVGTIAATDVQSAIAEVAAEAGAGVSDGDKGDVVVSSSGTVWTVEAGNESAAGKLELATAAETLTGTSTALATHPAGVLATYPRGLATIAATGAVVSFAIPQYYGSASAVTGNITFSTTGAILGMEQVMRHNEATEPTFPSEFKRMEGSRAYVPSVDNFIYMKYLSATKIHYTINQEQ